SALDWSRDEKWLLAMQSVSSSESYLWKIDVATGEKTLLTPKGERPVQWSGASFAGGGPAVFAVGNLNGESPRIFRFDGSTWTAVTPANEPIEAFAASPDGGTL